MEHREEYLHALSVCESEDGELLPLTKPETDTETVKARLHIVRRLLRYRGGQTAWPVSYTHLDVRVKNEVTAIRPEENKVTVKNLLTGENYEESYDHLIIATGSSPLKPGIPGINGEHIFTLWNIADTDRIKAFVDVYKKQTFRKPDCCRRRAAL